MSSECQSKLLFRNRIIGVKYNRAFQKRQESELRFAIFLTQDGNHWRARNVLIQIFRFYRVDQITKEYVIGPKRMWNLYDIGGTLERDANGNSRRRRCITRKIHKNCQTPEWERAGRATILEVISGNGMQVQIYLYFRENELYIDRSYKMEILLRRHTQIFYYEFHRLLIVKKKEELTVSAFTHVMFNLENQYAIERRTEGMYSCRITPTLLTCH